MNLYACPTPYQADAAAGFYVFCGRMLPIVLTGDPIGGPGPIVTDDQNTPLVGTPTELGSGGGSVLPPFNGRPNDSN